MATKNLFSVTLNCSINEQEDMKQFGPPDNSAKFYLHVTPNFSLPSQKDTLVVYLRRSFPHDNDIEVLCTISIQDKDGKKVRTQASKMFFIKKQNASVDGGVYYIRRDYLSNSTLVIDGKITIYGEVEILNEEKEFSLIKSTKLQYTVEKMIENYQSLLDDPKHSDVVFVVGGKQFKLHKNILSVRSPVFAAMFDSDLEENKQNRVEIPDVDVEAFEELLRFIYTGKVPSMDQNTMELFIASDKYQFESIKEMCELTLCENISIDSLASVLTLADMHSAIKLKSKCIEFFSKNATKVMQTEGWKEMVKTKGNLVMEVLQEIASKAEPYFK